MTMNVSIIKIRRLKTIKNKIIVIFITNENINGCLDVKVKECHKVKITLCEYIKTDESHI